MSKNKINFTVKVGDEELQLAVVKPNAAVHQESQRVWNKTLNQALASGAMLAKKKADLLKDAGIWNEDKEAEYEGMLKVIATKEAALKKGGITKAQGKKLALEIRKLRADARRFRAAQNYLNDATAEDQADSKRFNYFIYACTLWNDGDRAGQRYFDSFEEYEESESPVATEAGIQLLDLMYEIKDDAPLKTVENQFLIKYGFANEEGILLDEQGRLISDDGKLIDKDGFYVNDQGQKVDRFGNLVIEDFSIDNVEFKD